MKMVTNNGKKNKNLIIADEFAVKIGENSLAEFTAGPLPTVNPVVEAIVDSPNKMKEAAENVSVPEGVPVEAEQALLKKMIQENPHAPLFAIIRDTLDDSDPNIWDDIIKEWIRKDYYIPIYGIRDGYLTELGLLYARNEYGLVFEP